MNESINIVSAADVVTWHRPGSNLWDGNGDQNQNPDSTASAESGGHGHDQNDTSGTGIGRKPSTQLESA